MPGSTASPTVVPAVAVPGEQVVADAQGADAEVDVEVQRGGPERDDPAVADVQVDAALLAVAGVDARRSRSGRPS